MIKLLSNLGQVFLEVRNIGNYWLRRAFLVVLLWPLLMIFASLLPPDMAIVAVPIVALVPILAAIFSVVGAADLFLVTVATATIPLVRRVLVKLGVFIGIELAIGVYFSLVPVSSDRALVPALILVFAAIALLSFGRRQGVIFVLLILAAIVLTMIFFLGGRKKAGAKLDKITNTITAPVSAAAAMQPAVGSYNLEHSGKKIVLPEGVKKAYFVMQPQNGCVTTSGKLSPECWSQKIEIPDGVWSMVSYPSLPILTCDEYPGGENSGCPNNPTTADEAGKKVKHISDRVPSEIWFANIQPVSVTIVMQFTY